MADYLETYIGDPERHFRAPSNVLEAAELSRKEMLVVLASWKNDLLELQHASDENMSRDREAPDGRTAEKLREVLRAIDDLKRELDGQ